MLTTIWLCSAITATRQVVLPAKCAGREGLVHAISNSRDAFSMSLQADVCVLLACKVHAEICSKQKAGLDFQQWVIDGPCVNGA